MAEAARRLGDEVVTSVRSSTRAEALRARGFLVTQEHVVDVAERYVSKDTHVLVCFPPDGKTDVALGPRLNGASAVSYLSSTGVYGDAQGIIDDETPLPRSPTDAQARILDAEAIYRAVGGVVLRAPGIYGTDRGLHIRVTSGMHRLPGDGAGYSSRIHAEDLASLLLASTRESLRGETFVVGDLEPARQCDVVRWICSAYGCQYPPSVPEQEVPETLRRNRRVDGTRALAKLDVVLRYPSYRDGMKRP